MRFELYCPGCGVREVDFESYHSVIMLAPNLALMQFDCPCCQTPLHVSVKLNRAQQESLRRIQDTHNLRPFDQLKDNKPVAVSYSAWQVVEADSDFLQILVAPPTSTPEARGRIQELHEQLEQIDSVDEAIRRIDMSRRHKHGYQGQQDNQDVQGNQDLQGSPPEKP
ncbi:MAG: hypothetical protein LBU61_04085 [Coriobacteriales bacterium]|jgi:hypothetical protein|nr:hypothetical protein [Coriobacteriales bacterium]